MYSERGCVYCAVRTMSLYIRHLNLSLQRLCRGSWLCPVTVKTQDRSQVNPCETCGEHCGNWTGFPPSTSVFPVSIVPPMLHTINDLRVAFTRRTLGRVFENFHKQRSLRNRGAIERKVLSLTLWRVNINSNLPPNILALNLIFVCPCIIKLRKII